MDPDDETPPDSWFGWLAWGCGGFALVLVVAVLLVIVVGVLVALAALGGKKPASRKPRDRAIVRSNMRICTLLGGDLCITSCTALGVEGAKD